MLYKKQTDDMLSELLKKHPSMILPDKKKMKNLTPEKLEEYKKTATNRVRLYCNAFIKNTNAYNMIFNEILKSEKKSERHLLLLFIETLLNENGKTLRSKLKL